MIEKSFQRKIELLAPARDLETGIVAINSGADAVYIGASQFGARQAAGNSINDIKELVEYAHLFGVKVYVALNTILTDEEVAIAERLITELYEIGVDALIVQDMSITKMNIPPIPLHCSTQMDNSSVEKVEFLSRVGFPRVVLARELSLKQIEEIHNAVPETELEVFVHGALCVSYSGRCYASQYCFGRSANRGTCAQFCRLPFTLVDADGIVVCSDKHLLSLKDMNRSAMLEEMLDAGVTSLKIEGRLKDTSYVKNITAYYRNVLDVVFAKRKEYVRASYGKVEIGFTPAPEKSFNRGFTDYLLKGDKSEITSFDTPKSKGEFVGVVNFVSRNYFTLSGSKLNNGDGACFIDANGKLQGFRVNKVEANRVFPQSMPSLFKNAGIYRNYDCEFERTLSRPDISRRLSIALTFSETADGFMLSGVTECGTVCDVEEVFAKDIALKPQTENITLQLKKWGNTPFEVSSVTVNCSKEWFVPSSLLSGMRRDLCERLVAALQHKSLREPMPSLKKDVPYISTKIDYTGNVSNKMAHSFYTEHCVKDIAPAYELEQQEGVPLMYCKHCIKYSFGWCSKEGNRPPYKEPFYLVSSDGRRFRLQFNCKECIMTVIPEK